jgi:hypothetical protein
LHFGNKSVGIHLLRGVLGFGALFVGASSISDKLWLSLVLLPAAVFLLKGCPFCWTIGLLETVAMAVHRRNENALLAHVDARDATHQPGLWENRKAPKMGQSRLGLAYSTAEGNDGNASRTGGGIQCHRC